MLEGGRRAEKEETGDNGEKERGEEEKGGK